MLLPCVCRCPNRGDNNLRSSYGRCMLSLMQQLPGAPSPSDVTAVLDVGCATGLSSLALQQLFPDAHITGVDLSPHMIAVGRHHQQQRVVSTVGFCCVAAGGAVSVIGAACWLDGWMHVRHCLGSRYLGLRGNCAGDALFLHFASSIALLQQLLQATKALEECSTPRK